MLTTATPSSLADSVVSWETFDFKQSHDTERSKQYQTKSSRTTAFKGRNHLDQRLSRMNSGAKASTSGSGSWEDLRKEARQLETQIDGKLISLSKVGSSSKAFQTSDRSPLLNNTEDQFESLTSELTQLLCRLTSVNDGLAEFAAKQPQAGAAIHHTLQRHRDILQDYKQEFTKTKANVEAAMDREDLLSSVHREIDDFKSGLGVTRKGANKRMDALLRESESARNSERMIDDQINIAIETRETLVNQRIIFKAIQTKINDLSNRFPMINSLVQKTNLRKRRDSIILGIVIGFCLLFMLWYAFA